MRLYRKKQLMKKIQKRWIVSNKFFMSFFICAMFMLLLFTSSSPVQGSGLPNWLDGELHDLLNDNGGPAFFTLPFSFQFDKIPQDPKNPLTRAKVALGKLLYHETAMGVNNVRDEGFETYSCASCHFAQAGFMNNLPQGIGEGGLAFGAAGEGRFLNDNYGIEPDSLEKPDLQPIRTPTVVNGAYQELMLWNGQFGGVGANQELLETTDKSWEDFGFPLEINALGLEGPSLER